MYQLSLASKWNKRRPRLVALLKRTTTKKKVATASDRRNTVNLEALAAVFCTRLWSSWMDLTCTVGSQAEEKEETQERWRCVLLPWGRREWGEFFGWGGGERRRARQGGTAYRGWGATPAWSVKILVLHYTVILPYILYMYINCIEITEKVILSQFV